MKKILSLILACAVLTSALVGCQPEEVGETDNSASSEISSEISSETSSEEQTVSETESEPEEEVEYYQYPSSENEFVLDPKTIGEFFPYDSTLDEIVELHKKLLGEEKLKDNMYFSNRPSDGAKEIIYKNCRLYDMSGVLIICFHSDDSLDSVAFFTPNRPFSDFEEAKNKLEQNFNLKISYRSYFDETEESENRLPIAYVTGEVHLENEDIKYIQEGLVMKGGSFSNQYKTFPFPCFEDKEIKNELYVAFFMKSNFSEV